MDEIRENLALLKGSLSKRVDGWALSQQSKLPFKVMVCRESLAWRMAELSRSAFEAFQKDRLIAGIALTRASVETSAALWYLCGKISACVESAEIGNIDDYVMKLMMGIKTDPPIDAGTGEAITPSPIHVGKFIESVSKDMNGFNKQYGYLCDYTHPNYAGTVFFYSKLNKSNGTADFGQSVRESEAPETTGVTNLRVSLLMFERSYNRIADIMPALIKLCEERLEKAGGGD